MRFAQNLRQAAFCTGEAAPGRMLTMSFACSLHPAPVALFVAALPIDSHLTSEFAHFGFGNAIMAAGELKRL